MIMIGKTCGGKSRLFHFALGDYRPPTCLVLAPLFLAYCLYRSAVDKSNFMVGSYGPKTEPHVFTTPMEDAPSGMISRGHYTVKSKFTDDDKNIYLEWEWAFDIKKEWE